MKDSFVCLMKDKNAPANVKEINGAHYFAGDQNEARTNFDNDFPEKECLGIFQTARIDEAIDMYRASRSRKH